MDRSKFYKSSDSLNDRGIAEKIENGEFGTLSLETVVNPDGSETESEIVTNEGKLMDAIAEYALQKRIEKLRLDFNEKFSKTRFPEYSRKTKENILAKKIEKLKNKFFNKPDSAFGERLLELKARSLEHANQTEEDNGIMEPASMPEKKEPTAKETPEKKALSVEDSTLQEKIYGLKKFWGQVLERTTGDKNNDERNQRELKTFKDSPYVWITGSLSNTIRKDEKKLEETTDKNQIEAIKRKLAKNNESLDLLKQAMHRNLPLKLDRKFTDKEIELDSRKLFNVQQSVQDINRHTGKKYKEYKIADVVQRQHGRFLVLKTDTGEEVELDADKAEKIIRENKKFEEIKKGDIVKVRVGGERGITTTYRILAIEDGKVSFEDLTSRKRGSTSIVIMKNLLFDKKTHFLIEEDLNPKKKNSNTIATSDTVIPGPATSHIITSNNEKRSPLIDKIIMNAKDLGFMNALVIARDFNLSKEESEKLYNEYLESEKNGEEGKSTGQEMIQLREKLKNNILKRRELEKALEEIELQKGKEKPEEKLKNKEEEVKKIYSLFNDNGYLSIEGIVAISKEYIKNHYKENEDIHLRFIKAFVDIKNKPENERTEEEKTLYDNVVDILTTPYYSIEQIVIQRMRHKRWNALYAKGNLAPKERMEESNKIEEELKVLRQENANVPEELQREYNEAIEKLKENMPQSAKPVISKEELLG